MARRPMQLGRPDVAEIIDELHRAEPPSWRKDIPEEASAEFERKLEASEFTTLMEAQRWFKEEHGFDLHYNRIWYWAKKLGGVLLVPRPSHSKKDDAASGAFLGQVNLDCDASYLADFASQYPGCV